ncbi:glycoside hydrolase family 127 protein [Echinicola shivajiensis]|uniref:glycoside hydrolase family 127 protein n=1 Tax=Echinicola shivajiensis TaxID=1035916 RepID=UPI001BFC9785|nr:beta-L-arabinofuranosidase domain-containing protein [Echinicola shivajiensis]
MSYQKIGLIIFLFLVFACSNPKTESKKFPNSSLQEVSFEEVVLKDDFFQPKAKVVGEVTIPHLLDIAENQGKIDNFRIVAGEKQGKLSLYNAPDSDVYKLIEAAAYYLHQFEDPDLENRIDEIIRVILAAQAENGYLHTQYMLDFDDPAAPSRDNKKVKTFGFGPENQWESLSDNWPFAYSQLYCAGHLMEAAVAYYRATGKRDFLDGAIKFADLIVKVFDEEKVKGYADHPQVEIGLMKIYELTEDKRYLDMADLFSRYVRFSRPVDLHQELNVLPLQEQTQAYGHCVRTAYIYSGATDVVRAKGSDDLKEALMAIWENVVSSKMYVHGGTGNGTHAEQHGESYDLPIRATYSETCANIAQGQWNHRLNLLTGEGKFHDIVEIEAFNSALSGISLDGKHYFYSNKLNLDMDNRKNQHTGVRSSYLFCCPSKVPGFVAGMGRWIYAKGNNELVINQYIGSEVKTTLSEGEEISLELSTDYPFGGEVKIHINEAPEGELNLKLRIPSWNRSQDFIPNSPYKFKTPNENNGGFELAINGEEIKLPKQESGYLILSRAWKNGDEIQLLFNMPARKIYTSPELKANSGRVVLSKGPLVYTLEGLDNDFDLREFVLPASHQISSQYDPEILGGTVVLSGHGIAEGKEVEFTAVPYYLWQNRGVYPLRTIVVENPEKVREEIEKEEKLNTNG